VSTPPLLLFVIEDLAVGGTELHLMRLLPRLRREGFEILLYVFARREAAVRELEAQGVEVRSPARAAGVEAARSAARRTGLDLLALPGLWRLVRRRRPAVVHLFLPPAYLLGGICARLAGQRVCVMSRRTLDDYQRNHPALARLEHALHRHMRALLGNSRAVVAQLLAEGAPPDRVGLIYNGVDPAPFATLPPRETLRAAAGLEANTLAMTVVANLHPYKGHGDLLEGLATVASALPQPWRLLCVGRDTGLGAALEARARTLGLGASVAWLGERADVHRLLAASDLGVLPSHQEGLSNSVLEGMTAGLPMVVTAVGGNLEAVEDGVSGVIVPPRDSRALGTAILDLARDPERRRRLGEAARQRATRVFSQEACVARYARLYTALIRPEPVRINQLLP
jgi:glycosyltransferase involved in cell wall biosynthesis